MNGLDFSRVFGILIPMSPEERALLERTYKLTEENNDILRALRRSQRVGTAFRAAYWILIILTSFGAYYFIQPYVQTLGGLYGNASDSLSQVKNITAQFSDLTK